MAISHYRDQLRKIKELGPVDSIKVDVDGTPVFLRPVDESEETVHLMTEWRNKYGHVFRTKFKATEDKTRKYIRNQIMDNPDRILFMIILKNQKIGHIGVFNYDEINNTVEIDNVLRGVRNNSPGLMEKVTKSIIRWMFEDLKLSKVLLKVSSDLYKAINLYERCHMLTVRTIPCKRVFTEDGWRWEETLLQTESDFGERYINTMEITKESYLLYEKMFK